MRAYFILILLLSLNLSVAQDAVLQSDSLSYLAEMKVLGRKFSNEFYPNYTSIYSLPEKLFVARMDSARKDFLELLEKYENRLEKKYAQLQQIEIKYYFDKLLIEYPLVHPIYVDKPHTPSSIPIKLKDNLSDFNKPELLTNSDFTNYVQAFLQLQMNEELRKSVYKNQDNQQLNAVWNLIPKFFSDLKCEEFWQGQYLYNHIDEKGIKNIEPIYKEFTSSCTDSASLNKVIAIYRADSVGRQDHVIKNYKSIGSTQLDMHLFLPDSVMYGKKRPVIIYFHGGSWSAGKPDWFFPGCSAYAKRGWIACAVEYRIYDRHGTLPFEAVSDAKSAIRWIRQHANEFNIDTQRIVASGNSAGGHLILCTALSDYGNQKNDDSRFSPMPNALLVNAGVYDLTDQITAWIRKDLKDKNLAKEISPLYLIKKSIPPTLIIHGEEDRNVPYPTAKEFVAKMQKAGDTNIKFHSLKGAGHFIWFDSKYASEVSKLRSEFLMKLGY